MTTRECNISIKLTDEERKRAHALADAGDESIGRWFRRIVNVEYERRFGQAPPPDAKKRMGRPKKVAP